MRFVYFGFCILYFIFCTLYAIIGCLFNFILCHLVDLSTFTLKPLLANTKTNFA